MSLEEGRTAAGFEEEAQRQGERVGFFTAPRGPPVVHFLSVSLEFATISNLRVFVAGFLEVEVQWTSDDDLFESSRLDPG